MGSLPNGRKAKEPLPDGSLSPMQGMDTCGPTAVLQSALKADFRESADPILNLKFPASFIQNTEGLAKIKSLVNAFIAKGGEHIQFNFLDRRTLLDAKEHPDKHRDLIVRVAGYSAYFVNLTSDVQDEIIRRTEQDL